MREGAGAELLWENVTEKRQNKLKAQTLGFVFFRRWELGGRGDVRGTGRGWGLEAARVRSPRVWGGAGTGQQASVYPRAHQGLQGRPQGSPCPQTAQTQVTVTIPRNLHGSDLSPGTFHLQQDASPQGDPRGVTDPGGPSEQPGRRHKPQTPRQRPLCSAGKERRSRRPGQ